MSDDQFSRSFQAQIDALTHDVSELKQVLKGRPDYDVPGAMTRLSDLEGKADGLQKIQEGFIRDNERRSRLVNIGMTAMTTALAGIIVQLFILITGTGGG